MSFSLQNCRVQSLFSTTGLPIDILRLDLIHPVISGNKWFKLKEYLHAAKTQKKTGLLTYGGAYSNHIVATAAAAYAEGFGSIGVIRGEEPPLLSSTLSVAKSLGMELIFVSREKYRQKEVPPGFFNQHNIADFIVIPEGGYGPMGKEGAKEILHSCDTNAYTHIVSAVGTGTTLAGLVDAALHHQKIIGIPVLKKAFSLQQEIADLLPEEKKGDFQLLQHYHFGGYAKQTPELIDFMNSFFERTGIPTDFVYTGKAFYAVFDLFEKGFFSRDDKILLIHSGGLQGNGSLPKGTLIFG